MRASSLRFLLTFCGAALLAFGIEIVLWTDSHLFKLFLSGLARLAGALIHLGGGLAEVTDAVVRHPVNGFAIKIANSCSGLEVVILLAAGMLAFPATWRQRAIGWAAGTLAIMTLNVVRIISLYYLGQYSLAWFDWAHLYAWDVLIIIGGLGVFFLWVRWLPPNGHGKRAAPNDENHPDRFPHPSPPPLAGEGDDGSLREFHANGHGKRAAPHDARRTT